MKKPEPTPTLRRPTAVSGLDAHLGYWLRCVSNQVSHAFSRRVEECGVTVAEWVVLRELYDGERTPSALAEKLGMTRGAISKLAYRLSAKLLIAQRARAADLRSQLLELTDLGRATVPVVAAAADENDEEFFGSLDRRTREIIERAMREVIRQRRLRSVRAH